MDYIGKSVLNGHNNNTRKEFIQQAQNENMQENELFSSIKATENYEHLPEDRCCVVDGLVSLQGRNTLEKDKIVKKKLTRSTANRAKQEIRSNSLLASNYRSNSRSMDRALNSAIEHNEHQIEILNPKLKVTTMYEQQEVQRYLNTKTKKELIVELMKLQELFDKRCNNLRPSLANQIPTFTAAKNLQTKQKVVGIVNYPSSKSWHKHKVDVLSECFGENTGKVLVSRHDYTGDTSRMAIIPAANIVPITENLVEEHSKDEQIHRLVYENEARKVLIGQLRKEIVSVRSKVFKTRLCSNCNKVIKIIDTL